jgi:hypothetical protein
MIGDNEISNKSDIKIQIIKVYPDINDVSVNEQFIKLILFKRGVLIIIISKFKVNFVYKIQKCLSIRNFQVKINKSVPQMYKIATRCISGWGVLSPILFSIYVNDMIDINNKT